MNSLSNQIQPPPGKARRAERGPVRRWIADLHAWIGAFVGLFVILVGSTGIALGFAYELMRAETGGFDITGPSADDVPRIEQMIARAQDAAGPEFTPLGYVGPHGEIVNPAPMIYGLSAPPEAGGEEQVITFDPATGEATGSFLLHDTWTHWLIDLHYELLAGDLGAAFMATIALLIALLALAGLVLWWPLTRSAMAKPFSFGWRGNYVRKSFSLHSLVGFWLAIPILLWGISGVYWNEPSWFPAAITPQLEAPDEATIARLNHPSCVGAVTPKAAMSSALAAVPQSSVVEMHFTAPWQPYHAIQLDARGRDQLDGDTRAWVSATCPDRVEIERLRGSEATGPWLTALHSGRIFGAFRQLVITMVGISFIMIGVTGLILWWRRIAPQGRRSATDEDCG